MKFSKANRLVGPTWWSWQFRWFIYPRRALGQLLRIFVDGQTI